MAKKSALFLLALVLFVSTLGSSVEDVDNLETEHHHHHNHSHRHHHVKAPVHAPSKAPTHAPKKAPTHAPIPPPPKAHHAYPPASPPHGCLGMCATYCKMISPKRHCMKGCTACCDKCKCVPGFKKCSNWDKVMIHGYIVKCP